MLFPRRTSRVIWLGVAALALGLAGTAGASSPAPLCATPNLKVSEVNGEGAAGTRILTVAYRNAGKASCRLGGFPGVTLYASGNRGLGVAKRLGSRFSTLTPKPGQRAYGDVTYSETPVPESEKCPVPAKLRIYPPDNRRSVSVALHDAGALCHGAEVDPIANTPQNSLDD